MLFLNLALVSISAFTIPSFHVNTSYTASVNSGFNLYCTANQSSGDVSSVCQDLNQDNTDIYQCLYVPGGQIPCTSLRSEITYNCLIITVDNSNGTTFQGTLNCPLNSPINSNRINSKRYSDTNNFDSKFSEEFNVQ
jgi:hypothetical protein